MNRFISQLTLVILLMAFFVLPLIAAESTSTSTIVSSTDFYNVKETEVLFTGIADSNIAGSTFAINSVPVVSLEIINNTTQTIAENGQGVAMPTGVRVEIEGAASPFMPSGTIKPLQRKNASLNKFGRYEIDTRGLGVLRANLISTTTPGIDVRCYFRYVETDRLPINPFSEEY